VPKVHTSDLYNTSITYNNTFFLKMYRKVERSIHPDLEISRFLSKEGKFTHIPAFIGSIEWKDKKGCIVLGQLQEMIENHGDGYSYFLERINNFIERIVAGQKGILAGQKEGPSPEERLGTLANPQGFEQLPENIQTLLGAPAAEQARLIGVRTAEMHLALASGTALKDFKPEPFSLHYQRSLFSSMQSLVRETYQNMSRYKAKLPADLQERTEQIAAYRPELLARLKRIYTKKLDTLKIRIHGNYHLGQILLTGKDIAITDYSGDPSLGYSERRLRRSPFVDLASMVVSLYDVAFEGFLNSQQFHGTDTKPLLPMASLWAHYMCGFFIKAYKEQTKGSGLIPSQPEDFEMMLQNCIVQKALNVFNDYLRNAPEKLIIPQTILRAVLQPAAATATATAPATTPATTAAPVTTVAPATTPVPAS